MQLEVKEQPTNLIVESADVHRATRLAILTNEVFADLAPSVHAPATIIKTRRARHRMPRGLKKTLIERICSVTDPSTAAMPRAMVIAAHQDDESIGAGSRLSRLTDVRVVHVTDGAPSDPAVVARYGYERREDYAVARRKEVVDAMRLAGVAEDHLVCLEYVDGRASERLVDLVLDITHLIDTHAPEVLITHPYEGGHTDHDATAFAVHLACGILQREGKNPPPVLEMASYHHREGQRIYQNFLPHAGADMDLRLVLLTEDDAKLKHDMFECFTTQQNVLKNFSTAFERFRPAPRYDFTRPPHRGQLNYERFGVTTFDAWRHLAEQALTKLRLRK